MHLGHFLSKFLLEFSGVELCFLMLRIIAAQILCSFHCVSLICKSKGNQFFPFHSTRILLPSADNIKTLFCIPSYCCCCPECPGGLEDFNCSQKHSLHNTLLNLYLFRENPFFRSNVCFMDQMLLSSNKFKFAVVV